jgi:hypothetical protein
MNPDPRMASRKKAKKLADYFPELEIGEIPDPHHGTRTVLRCTDCEDYSDYIGYVSSGCKSCGYTLEHMYQGTRP